MSLSGQVALVTGGGTGIGKAIAQAMLAEGAKIIIVGRKEEVLKEAQTELGSGVEIMVCDVTQEDQVDRVYENIMSNHGRLDILINNAGMQHRTELHNFPADAFERLLQTNVASVFHVGQAVARHMIDRKQGKIINIASVQTALARPGIAPYTATKGAVGNLTKGMATDWAQYGINCNAIAPGYFDTPLNAALVADDEFSAWLAKRTPAGRWGDVEELVGAAVFLASAASTFVNGHTLYVDGGITASL